MSSLAARDEVVLAESTVAVYGLGKMGLPLACVLADNGAEVVGVDVDESVVESVNDGRSPVENEPGLPELLTTYGGDGLTATTDGVEAARETDVMVVLVPTVVDDDFHPRMEPVLDVAEDISAGVDSGDLVILESTVPPGTTEEEFVEALESGEMEAGEDFAVAHCPERTSSGRVIRDVTESYPKIVGGVDEHSTRLAGSLYRSFNEPGVVEMSSARAAEAVKVFEGVYRDTNIALANELAKACEEWGLDSQEVFSAANSQPYCDIHEPGVGVGGHCIPVYPHFVIDRAEDTRLLKTSREVNDGMPRHTAGMLETLLANKGVPVDEAEILVLGVTYRAGVKETRYAPALDLIETLREREADVSAHDPMLSAEEVEDTGARYSELEGGGFDGVVLVTGHDEYRDIDVEEFADSMDTPVLVDGRRFFDADKMRDAGFTYGAVGLGKHDQA